MFKLPKLLFLLKILDVLYKRICDLADFLRLIRGYFFVEKSMNSYTTNRQGIALLPTVTTSALECWWWF